VLYYRDAGREGQITSDGKPYSIAILDENEDGRFDDLAEGTLIIDLNQDGKLVGDSDSAEHHKLDQPFNIHGKVWEVASLSPDGTSLSLRPSEAKVEMQAYLEPGYPAPKFTAQDLDGKPVDLAEEAAGAKYVLLDFWASWCVSRTTACGLSASISTASGTRRSKPPRKASWIIGTSSMAAAGKMRWRSCTVYTASRRPTCWIRI
jgi:hypothetical protein